ncbi:MAG: T9SS type A sorting domain-containing protein [Bacteroidota bacterium]|nr:T9SS type A sorting domain-containing protein [Bacteroidota bacterium]
MKHTYLLIIFCIASIISNAQQVNGVNTNPQNPINPPFLPWANMHLGSGFTHDPFLNRFNWSPIDANGNSTDLIPIEYNTGFNIAGISLSSNQIPMRNPFRSGMGIGASAYIDALLTPTVLDRDFRWQDGWELLYMNLGYTPNLDQINIPNPLNPLDITGPNPSHAPYFVLYNKYKGTVRLFANVWFNNTTANKPQKVMATLQFSNDEVNGLLRHNSSYDLALDQPTIIEKISGPSYNFADQFKWLMSDYQVGFDPCICNRTTNNTRLQFEFRTINSMDIDMTSRSIAVNKAITSNSYLTDDFLNLGDVDFNNPNTNKPGSRMYKEMGSLLDGYKAAQLKYEKDLANYNSTEGILKRAAIDILKDGITATGSMVGAGVAGSFFTNSIMKKFILKNKTRVGLFNDGLIALDTNDADAFAKSVTGATKSIIASGFDFLSTTIDVPQKPTRPSAPTATFTETTYKGTVTHNNEFKTDDLLIPGSLPISFPNGDPGLNRLNYPAYNEVLGLFALLETPEVEVVSKRKTSYESQFNIIPNSWYRWAGNSTQKKQYQIRVKDKLSYRFNHVVDFDFDKTKLYYSFRIKLKNILPKVEGLPNYINDKIMLKESKSYGQIVTDSNFVFTESYDKNGSERLIVITTPFTEVKNILNEPFEFTNIANFLYGLINRMGANVDEFESSFLANLGEFSSIESIELKLMADMYFLNPGSKGQEINTLQTFTYKIYQNSGNDNQMPTEQDNTIGNVTFLGQNNNILKHQSGNVVFDNIMLSPNTLQPYTHTWINGNEIHIWVENATLKNNIEVAQGYTAYIHFLGSAVIIPEAEISPELVLDNLRSEDLYQYPFIFEATDSEVNDFCSLNNAKYQANSTLTKRAAQANEDNSGVSLENKNPIFQIYPNPANNFCILKVELENATTASITINNLSGSMVKKIELQNSSVKETSIETESFESGIYFVTLTISDGFIQTKKLLIVR